MSWASWPVLAAVFLWWDAAPRLRDAGVSNTLTCLFAPCIRCTAISRHCSGSASCCRARDYQPVGFDTVRRAFPRPAGDGGRDRQVHRLYRHGVLLDFDPARGLRRLRGDRAQRSSMRPPSGHSTLTYMLYAALFMLGAAYALAQGRAHPHRLLLGELRASNKGL